MVADSASCSAKWKQTKLSSAARPATCTRRSGPSRSPAPAAKIKPPSWESWSAAVRFAQVLYRTGRRRRFSPKCASTWKRDRPSYTDALKSYDGLSEFEHQVVDHAVQYVDGKVHTNGLENFWSLLKRGLNGTYI